MQKLKLYSLVLALLLTGCAIPEFKPQGAYRYVKVTIIVDDNIIFEGNKVKGLATCFDMKERLCILKVPSIHSLDDPDWYYWGKELGHAYFDNYHEGVDDIY